MYDSSRQPGRLRALDSGEHDDRPVLPGYAGRAWETIVGSTWTIQAGDVLYSRFLPVRTHKYYKYPVIWDIIDCRTEHNLPVENSWDPARSGHARAQDSTHRRANE